MIQTRLVRPSHPVSVSLDDMVERVRGWCKLVTEFEVRWLSPDVV